MGERMASRQLIDAEERLRLFVEGVSDYALMMLDPDGYILSWNRGAQSIKRYAASEIIGRHFSLFYPQEDIAAGKPAYELEVAARTGRFEDTGIRVRKDGSRFWANVLITALHDDDGRLIGFGKITRDITETVEARTRLRDSEMRLQNLVDTVLDTVVDGIITIDKQGLIQSYNRACGRLFGYTIDEVLGKNVSMLMPEPYRSEHDQYLANYLTTHKPKIIGIGREVVGRRKDGSTFPMELAVGEAMTGGRHAFVGIIRDVTERTEAENSREQLRQSQKMDALGQLTGGIAHDFNNLLGIIIGNLDLLQTRVSAEPALNELVESALDASLRGAELTRRLLTFSRKQPLRPKVLNLNDHLPGIAGLLRRVLGENIVVTVVPATDLWHAIVDPSQLENAVVNLSINARDAMPDGGTLVIETANTHLDEHYAAQNVDTTAGHYVMFAITDTGSGMSPEVVGRAFEPFFTTKPLGQGTGLGLSSVYGFVKQSGGHIKIYSEEGHGTSVKIYLPATTELGAARSSEGAGAVERAPSGTETILIVEDNADMRATAARLLSELGYRVLQVADGPAATRVLQQDEPIDLLFTDVVMPGGMSGYQLAAEAKRLRPQLKILFTSGYAEASMRNRGEPSRQAPADAEILPKPYRRDEVAKRIRTVLDRD